MDADQSPNGTVASKEQEEGVGRRLAETSTTVYGANSKGIIIEERDAKGSKEQYDHSPMHRKERQDKEQYDEKETTEETAFAASK